MISKDLTKDSKERDHNMQDSKLVLSELVSKSEAGNTGLGLANPFKPDDNELYVVVDKDLGTPDAAGDLDFYGSVDKDGTLHVSWVSYKGTGSAPAECVPVQCSLSHEPEYGCENNEDSARRNFGR